MKTVVEDMIALDANKLAHMDVFVEGQPSVTIRWVNGSSVALMYDRNVLYAGCKINGVEKIQEISVLTAPCQFGGKRYYFRCPKCCRRRYKLRVGREGALCRQCYKAPYFLQECSDYDALIHKYNKAMTKLQRPMRSATRVTLELEASHFKHLANISWMGEAQATYKDMGIDLESEFEEMNLSQGEGS